MMIGDLPRDAATQLRLALIGTGVAIAERLGNDAPEFMLDYPAEAATLAGRPVTATEWQELVARRFPSTGSFDRLAATLDDSRALDVLLTIGLAAEDSRFGAAMGENGRLTLATLVGLWRNHGGTDDPQGVRRCVGQMVAGGILHAVNADAPRLDQELAVSAAVWDALGGETTAPSGCKFVALADLARIDDLMLDLATAARTAALAEAMAADAELAVTIRGPSRNGRRTLAGALARQMQRPLLHVGTNTPEAWRQAGLFAFLHDAVVVTAPLLAPGETRDLPVFALEPVRLIIVTGHSGGIRTTDRPQVTLALPMPGLDERQRHWEAALPAIGPGAAHRLAAAFQLTSGTIRRAARGAAVLARQAGRDAPNRADVRLALRDLQDSRLETVAARVETGTVGEFLALDETTRDELAALDVRCRNREALSSYAGHGPGALGVRALFAGPSGAGKTLAARRLSTDLARDIWRIDLSATVSKYIGETEKALDRAFAAAEELDAILLIDEGDALMAKRTDVGNANDRYANLETNFLLQRIESFSGILIVTTNAADRIDAAFSRRMDAVVQFRAPDELRRYEILDRHLGDHRASDDLVQEIAVRCALSGGQLRNVALHARLLSLDRNRPIGDHELREALVREYRKTDAHCPLKPVLAAVG